MTRQDTTRVKGGSPSTRNSLTAVDRHRLWLKLQEVCSTKIVDGVKRADYQPGWNDDRVVAEAGPPITKASVQHDRLKIYGVVRVRPPRKSALETALAEIAKVDLPQTVESIVQVVDTLLKRVETLETRAADLAGQIDILLAQVASGAEAIQRNERDYFSVKAWAGKRARDPFHEPVRLRSV
jgi:hypothetical protein